MKYSALFVFALVSLSMAATQDKFLKKQCDGDFVASTGAPGPNVRTECKAELCLDDNFGNCKTLGEGDYSMGDLANNGVPNDSVESVRVTGQPGCHLRIYQHADKGGWQISLPEGEYTCAQIQAAGGKCNDLSTATVYREEPAPVVDPVTIQPVQPTGPTPCEAQLCLDDNFGNCKTLGEGDYSMGDLANAGVPNDSVDSVRVTGQPNCALRIYQHADKGGWQVTLPEGEYTCADIVAAGGKCNDLSTATVFRDEPVTVTPCELTLCQNNDFSNCITIPEGEYKLDQLQALGMPNDSTDAVRLTGSPGCKAELWQHNFGGWRVDLEEGEYNCAQIQAMGGQCNDLSSAKVYRDQ